MVLEDKMHGFDNSKGDHHPLQRASGLLLVSNTPKGIANVLCDLVVALELSNGVTCT